MSKAIDCMEEFENQKPLKQDFVLEEKIAKRLSIRYGCGYRWNDYDEVEFFDLDDSEVE